MYVFIAISKGGLELASQLRAMFPNSVIYTTRKLYDAEYELIDGELAVFTGVLFEKYRTLVFIMASGIVVRCIAPYIKHKAHDPAVLVIDETGKFVISLLSGHLGGANAVAEIIAHAINAIPVITTASDVHGVLAVDMIAKQNCLIINDLDEAKFVTSALIEGKHVAICNQTLSLLQSAGDVTKAEAIVFISHTTKQDCNVLHTCLLVPNIIVGIGCRRGTSSEHIIRFIIKTLACLNIDVRCVNCFASIDIKSDEEGMLIAADFFNKPLVFISSSEIKEVEANFESSQFVKQSVGVGAVCEPAAFIAGNKTGRFLKMKSADNGVTLSVFETADMSCMRK